MSSNAVELRTQHLRKIESLLKDFQRCNGTGNLTRANTMLVRIIQEMLSLLDPASPVNTASAAETLRETLRLDKVSESALLSAVVVDHPTVKQPAVEQTPVEQTPVEQPTVEKPTVEEPAAEQTSVEQTPVVDEVPALPSGTAEPETAHDDLPADAEVLGGAEHKTAGVKKKIVAKPPSRD